MYYATGSTDPKAFLRSVSRSIRQSESSENKALTGSILRTASPEEAASIRAEMAEQVRQANIQGEANRVQHAYARGEIDQATAEQALTELQSAAGGKKIPWLLIGGIAAVGAIAFIATRRKK